MHNHLLWHPQPQTIAEWLPTRYCCPSLLRSANASMLCSSFLPLLQILQVIPCLMIPYHCSGFIIIYSLSHIVLFWYKVATWNHVSTKSSLVASLNKQNALVGSFGNPSHKIVLFKIIACFSSLDNTRLELMPTIFVIWTGFLVEWTEVTVLYCFPSRSSVNSDVTYNLDLQPALPIF